MLQNFIDPSKYGLPQLVQRMKMILIAFLEEMESAVQKPTRGRRLATLEEEGNKVLALLVRQLFLASRDWALARRIGSPDPRQLLEWRVVVHTLGELAEMFGEALRALNELAGKLPTEAAGVVGTAVPDLKVQLKAVVEALMHPSLDHACGVYYETRNTMFAPGSSGRRAASAGKAGSTRAISQLLERGAGCLALLAEVAIDRAVAAGAETILVEAA